jgi:hypothetical protein
MGYRGKVVERARARDLRAQAWTINEIVAQRGVSNSSVSVWVRDVEFDAATRPARSVTNRNRGARNRRPNRLQQRQQAEIERFVVEGRQRIGRLSERDLLVAGTALYAGEGNKTDGEVRFSNSDPRMIGLFCAWLRRFFDVDESRLRGSTLPPPGFGPRCCERVLVRAHRYPAGPVRQALSRDSRSEHSQHEASDGVSRRLVQLQPHSSRSDGLGDGAAILRQFVPG